MSDLVESNLVESNNEGFVNHPRGLESLHLENDAGLQPTYASRWTDWASDVGQRSRVLASRVGGGLNGNVQKSPWLHIGLASVGALAFGYWLGRMSAAASSKTPPFQAEVGRGYGDFEESEAALT